MLAGERPRIDRRSLCFREAGVEIARNLRLAERGAPGRRRMDREPAEGEPVRRADDDDRGGADRAAAPMARRRSRRPSRNRRCRRAARRRLSGRRRRRAGPPCPSARSDREGFAPPPDRTGPRPARDERCLTCRPPFADRSRRPGIPASAMKRRSKRQI